jgi:hypothetical protein
MARFIGGLLERGCYYVQPDIMTRHLSAALVALVAIGAAPLGAQTDVSGEWEASYTTPLGTQELKIYLTQEGPRVTGHTTSEYGESMVRGTITGQDIQFSFSTTDAGKAVDIRVAATVEGNKMRGTAKIGDRAEGVFTAERSDSAAGRARSPGLRNSANQRAETGELSDSTQSPSLRH